MLDAIRRGTRRFTREQDAVFGRPANERVWRRGGNITLHEEIASMPVPTLRRRDGALLCIEPDAYASWRGMGLAVEPDHLHALLHRAADLLFDVPTVIQTSPNGYCAEVLKADGTPVEWFEGALVSHLVVLAALLR